MKEQIEEMAFDLCRIDTCKHLPQEECNNTTCALCEAEALYNAGYRKQEWISVEDRLPEHEERCLIFTKIHFIPDHVDECDYYEGVEISTFYQDRFLSNNGMYATHWMPLHEPPKGE